jgi:recombination protein RecA
MAPKKKDKNQIADSAYSKFQAKKVALGLGSALKLADDYSDINVEFVKTGFPSFDLAINKDEGGLPRARHIEIFAKKESSGKTSLALAFAKSFQDMGLSVGIIDIEKTITEKYLKMHGIQTKEEENLSKLPIDLMRSQIDPDSDEKFDLFLEDILDTVTNASKIYDLLIVDSVDALVTEEEANKSADKNARVGGISMKLSQFFRKNTNTHACVLWINQTRQSPGAYSPQGGITYVTSGGRALPFYSSVRLELTVVEKLRENAESDPYGFVTKILVVKNKVGPPLRIATLYYLNGEGFSKSYDYFTLAVKMGVIFKAGAWFKFYKKTLKDGISKEELELPENIYLKSQGELKTYQTIRDNPELMKALIAKVSGEDTEVELAPEGTVEDTAEDYDENSATQE